MHYDNPTEYGNLTFKVTTEPSIEPITADDVKLYARIDGSSEDTLIESFITAVRKTTEAYLGRALISQTITASLDVFGYFNRVYSLGIDPYSGCDFWRYGSQVIELPRPPLISVTEVRTVDEDGTETTYSSDNYYIRTVPEPGQLVIKFEKTPPINTERYYGGYEIEFVAGYGTAVTDVPENIKLGMLMWVADVYENRIPVATPPGIVDTIMSPERIIPL